MTKRKQGSFRTNSTKKYKFENPLGSNWASQREIDEILSVRRDLVADLRNWNGVVNYTKHIYELDSTKENYGSYREAIGYHKGLLSASNRICRTVGFIEESEIKRGEFKR